MKFLWTKWSEWSEGNSSNAEELLHQRRHILFSRFALFAFLIVSAHAVQDGYYGLLEGFIYDSVIGLVILATFLMNRRGHHKAAKVLMLFFLNCAMALYCSVIPKHNGVFLFFFPLIGLSSVVFDYRNRNWGFFFVGLSAAFLVALVLTDFKLLGNVTIPAIPEQNSFLINLTSSSLILVLCINFMMKYNDESERRLMKLAAEIGQKNTHLEKTNSELDQFVYSASHDLRAPLLSIQGIVNIANYENHDPGVGEYLTMINGQVLKMDHFIKDIINYSHNTRTEVVEQAIDFSKVLDAVHESLKFMDGVEKIRWVKEIEEPLDWKTDMVRIGTVLRNLISNAIKYHNYSREDRWVKIGVRKILNTCCITVKDNGVGIPAEHHQKVFDMFYKAHDNSTGSGLGLYIVKEIVGKMNGTIQLQSQPGQGSTFIITLPLLAA